MNTQIVYVVISNSQDIYFEQVWASAWSLKHYNPDAHVIVLTDKETRETIYSDERKESLNYIDEIVTVDFDSDYSNKERSRWIKTNMRSLITGDFLFIDADTIITGSLDDIDNLSCSIGAVLDSHCHSKEISDTVVFQDMYIDRLRNIFGMTYDGQDVFNSGVLYVKDNKVAHDFFRAWHDNWLKSNSAGIVLDQLPLLKTNIDFGQIITEISGMYNCQICFSIQFLTRAMIVHTFAHQKSKSPLSQIMGVELYESLKKQGYISDSISRVLLSCKESFVSPSYLVGKEWMKIRFQPAFFLIEKTYLSRNLCDRYALIIFNFIAKILSLVLRIIQKSNGIYKHSDTSI